MWAFNLRTRQLNDSDSEDGDGACPDKISDDKQFLNDIDLSSRPETAQYKPNPWSIAKVNAASRPNVVSKAGPAKKVPTNISVKPAGGIVDGFRRQAERAKTPVSKSGRSTPQTIGKKLDSIMNVSEQSNGLSIPASHVTDNHPAFLALSPKITQNPPKNGRYASTFDPSRPTQSTSHISGLSKAHIPHPSAQITKDSNKIQNFPHSFSSPVQPPDRTSSHIISNSSPARPSYGYSSAAAGMKRNLTPRSRKYGSIQASSTFRSQHSPAFPDSNSQAPLYPLTNYSQLIDPQRRYYHSPTLSIERQQNNVYNSFKHSYSPHPVSRLDLQDQTGPQPLSSSTDIHDSDCPTSQPNDITKMPEWLTSALHSQPMQTVAPSSDPEYPANLPNTKLFPSSGPLLEFSYPPETLPVHILPRASSPPAPSPYSRKPTTPPSPCQFVRPTPQSLPTRSATPRRDAYKPHMFQDYCPDSTWSTFPVRKKVNTGCVSTMCKIYDSSQWFMSVHPSLKGV
jgi:hypothetical protein